MRISYAASTRIFSSFVASVIARHRAYRAYRQRLRELDSLDDREMSDLGISRADYPLARPPGLNAPALQTVPPSSLESWASSLPPAIRFCSSSIGISALA